MKTTKMFFFVILTAMFFIANLTFAQVNEKGDCQKKCEKECTKMQNKSECQMKSSECKMQSSECQMKCSDKKGNSQGTNMDSAKVCVVTGEKIDGTEGEPLKLTYLGKEYLFCCKGCVEKFKAEPMDYVKGDINCPVMGNPASKKVFTVVDGVKYYFCCKGCISKFEKEPEKYLNK